MGTNLCLHSKEILQVKCVQITLWLSGVPSGANTEYSELFQKKSICLFLWLKIQELWLEANIV